MAKKEASGVKFKLNQEKIPTHVAIIMDGNRRWAAAHGMGPVAGHEYVAKKIMEPIVKHCIALGIPYLTFWCFSTENWRRDKAEVEGVMNLFRTLLKKKVEKYQDLGVRLNVLGDLSRFAEDIVKKVKEGLEETKKNKKVTVSLALNYGGRDEVVRAIKKIFREGLTAGEITEEVISSYLDSADIPDPDLIIRTGGELRLSGYLPWQSVYSELYFTPVLMPEFTVKEFDKAILDYQRRERRFGGGKFKDYRKQSLNPKG